MYKLQETPRKLFSSVFKLGTEPPPQKKKNFGYHACKKHILKFTN